MHKNNSIASYDEKVLNLKLEEQPWPILQEIKPSDVIFAKQTKSEHSEIHVLTSIGG